MFHEGESSEPNSEIGLDTSMILMLMACFQAQTRSHILRRVNTATGQRSIVSMEVASQTFIDHRILLRYRDIENADRVLLMGTTLATYSAFR